MAGDQWRSRLALVSFIVAGCSFHSAPTVEPQLIRPVTPPIERSVTLLVTDEFANFVLQGSQDNREFRYDLGPGALAAVRDLLHGSFTAFVEHKVPSDAIALLQFTSQTNDSSNRDLLALVKFPMGAGTYVRPAAAGLEVRLQLDIVSQNRTFARSFLGIGRASSGIYLGSAMAAAGNRALSAAVAALADSLLAHRSEF
jgi:hypothetical protein